jgi:hypothetical protein
VFFFLYFINGRGDKTLRRRLGEMGHGSDPLVLLGINLNFFHFLVIYVGAFTVCIHLRIFAFCFPSLPRLAYQHTKNLMITIFNIKSENGKERHTWSIYFGV